MNNAEPKNWTLEEFQTNHPGQVVCPPCRGAFSVSSWTLKYTYKLGFIGAEGKKTATCMADGMTLIFDSDEEVIDFLNDGGYIPMPTNWLIASIIYMDDWREWE